LPTLKSDQPMQNVVSASATKKVTTGASWWARLAPGRDCL